MRPLRCEVEREVDEASEVFRLRPWHEGLVTPLAIHVREPVGEAFVHGPLREFPPVSFNRGILPERHRSAPCATDLDG